MRYFLLILSVFIPTAVAVAQNSATPSTLTAVPAPSGELPYNELMRKGENFLIPNEKKVVYEGAAILMFYRASRVAPDELRTAFEALLASPVLPPDSRLTAHESIAELHNSRVRYLDAALEYQKILAFPNVPKQSQAEYISRALAELGKASADARTLALLNTLNAQYLPLLATPEERAKAKNNWANALERQGDSPAAIRQWNELADDTEMPLAQ